MNLYTSRLLLLFFIVMSFNALKSNPKGMKLPYIFSRKNTTTSWEKIKNKRKERLVKEEIKKGARIDVESDFLDLDEKFSADYKSFSWDYSNKNDNKLKYLYFFLEQMCFLNESFQARYITLYNKIDKKSWEDFYYARAFLRYENKLLFKTEVFKKYKKFLRKIDQDESTKTAVDSIEKEIGYLRNNFKKNRKIIKNQFKKYPKEDRQKFPILLFYSQQKRS